MSHRVEANGGGGRGMKHLDLREFVDSGYLQEVNRRFFHPLGLALAVMIDDMGTVELDEIRDGRDDVEGNVFDQVDLAKAEYIQAEWDDRAGVRQCVLGYVIQPVDNSNKA